MLQARKLPLVRQMAVNTLEADLEKSRSIKKGGLGRLWISDAAARAAGAKIDSDREPVYAAAVH